MNRRCVWITQETSKLDTSQASQFGEPRYITGEHTNPFDIPTIEENVARAVDSYNVGDYILVIGNTVSAVVSMFLLHRIKMTFVGPVKLLLFDAKTSKYKERTIP